MIGQRRNVSISASGTATAYPEIALRLQTHPYQAYVLRMLRLAGLRRLLFAILAIVNVGASPLAMAGEAQLVSESIRQGLHNHIEDHSRPGCAPVHPDQCILCNFLAHVTPEREPAAPQHMVVRTVSARRVAPVERRAGALFARPRTRAPPTNV